MNPERVYNVTVKHPTDYHKGTHAVTVRDASGSPGKVYCVADGFGCSRDYAADDASAVRAFLAEHACQIVAHDFNPPAPAAKKAARPRRKAAPAAPLTLGEALGELMDAHGLEPILATLAAQCETTASVRRADGRAVNADGWEYSADALREALVKFRRIRREFLLKG